jgi:hypothetical protein
MPDYSTMEAGREMDALVAEKVMGWTFCDYSMPGTPWEFTDPPEERISIGVGLEPGTRRRNRIPNYSTSISAAWEVVEKFRQRQWKIQVIGHEWYDGGLWECVLLDALNSERGRALDRQVHDGKSGWPEPSAPLAICRAALKAVDHA